MTMNGKKKTENLFNSEDRQCMVKVNENHLKRTSHFESQHILFNRKKICKQAKNQKPLTKKKEDPKIRVNKKIEKMLVCETRVECKREIEVKEKNSRIKWSDVKCERHHDDKNSGRKTPNYWNQLKMWTTQEAKLLNNNCRRCQQSSEILMKVQCAEQRQEIQLVKDGDYEEKQQQQQHEQQHQAPTSEPLKNISQM